MNLKKLLSVYNDGHSQFGKGGLGYHPTRMYGGSGKQGAMSLSAPAEDVQSSIDEASLLLRLDDYDTKERRKEERRKKKQLAKQEEYEEQLFEDVQHLVDAKYPKEEVDMDIDELMEQLNVDEDDESPPKKTRTVNFNDESIAYKSDNPLDEDEGTQEQLEEDKAEQIHIPSFAIYGKDLEHYSFDEFKDVRINIDTKGDLMTSKNIKELTTNIMALDDYIADRTFNYKSKAELLEGEGQIRYARTLLKRDLVYACEAINLWNKYRGYTGYGAEVSDITGLEDTIKIILNNPNIKKELKWDIGIGYYDDGEYKFFYTQDNKTVTLSTTGYQSLLNLQRIAKSKELLTKGGYKPSYKMTSDRTLDDLKEGSEPELFEYKVLRSPQILKLIADVTDVADSEVEGMLLNGTPITSFGSFGEYNTRDHNTKYECLDGSFRIGDKWYAVEFKKFHQQKITPLLAGIKGNCYAKLKEVNEQLYSIWSKQKKEDEDKSKEAFLKEVHVAGIPITRTKFKFVSGKYTKGTVNSQEDFEYFASLGTNKVKTPFHIDIDTKSGKIKSIIKSGSRQTPFKKVTDHEPDLIICVLLDDQLLSCNISQKIHEGLLTPDIINHLQLATSPYNKKKKGFDSYNIPIEFFDPVLNIPSKVTGEGLRSSKRKLNNEDEDIFIESIKLALKNLAKLKKKSINKGLDLVKADAIHIQAHPSKEDINELIEDINKSQRSIKGGTIYRTYNHGSKDPYWSYKDDGQELLVTTKKGKTEDQDDISYDRLKKGYKEQVQAIIDGSIDLLSRTMADYTPDERNELMLMNQEDKPKGNRLQLTARDIGIAERGPTIGFNKDKELLIRKALKPHGLEIPKTPAELRAIKDKVSKEEYRSIVSHNLKMTQGYNEVNTSAFQRAIESQLLEQKLKHEDEATSTLSKAHAKAFAKLEESQKGVVNELIKSEESKKKKDKKKKKKAKASGKAEESSSDQELSEEEADVSKLLPKQAEEQPKIPKSKKSTSLINDYEITQAVHKIHLDSGLTYGKSFEDALLLPSFEHVLKSVFSDSSDIRKTDDIPELKGFKLSSGEDINDLCIYDLYSNDNVYELKNFDDLSIEDIKKRGGIYINKAKLYGTDLFRPEFYEDNGDIKLHNVVTTIHTPQGTNQFNLFTKSGKTLSLIYKLKDGVYRYDLSKSRDFNLVPLLDSKGHQIRKGGRKIMVFDPDQPRVVQDIFLGKECFVLNPLHLYKI